MDKAGAATESGWREVPSQQADWFYCVENEICCVRRASEAETSVLLLKVEEKKDGVCMVFCASAWWSINAVVVS